MDGQQQAGGNHDSGDGKSISIGQVGQVLEYTDDDDGSDQQNPVDSWDINLTLDSLRGVKHLDRREGFAIDNLLDKTECSGDKSLRGNELSNSHCRKIRGSSV